MVSDAYLVENRGLAWVSGLKKRGDFNIELFKFEFCGDTGGIITKCLLGILDCCG